MKSIALLDVLQKIPFLEKQNPSGPKGFRYLGSLLQFTKDPLNFLLEVAIEHNHVAFFKLGPFRAALLTHPDHVQHVHVDQIDNYPKSELYDKLMPILGQGLLTSKGTHWKKMRKIIAPSFHPRKISAYADIMTEEAASLVKKWKESSQKSVTIDLWEEMSHVTQKIVTRSLLGILLEGTEDKIEKHLAVLNDITNQRFYNVIPFYEKLPLAINRRYDMALKGLEDIIYELIHAGRKKERTGEEVDLLSVLLDLTDEDGVKLTDVELRDEVMTFYLAGHETTANALSWMWVLLSKHPEWMEKLKLEVARVCEGRAPRLEDFSKLNLCKMVFEEALRLYPPLWTWSRTAAKDDTIGDVKIPAGTLVIMSTWVTHRHPDFWEEPEKFNPERFGKEASAKRHPYAYFPFSAGQRMCIGNRFALIEAVIIIATIIQHCDINVTAPEVVSPNPVLTLRAINRAKAQVNFL
jgi:cytochrome P450